MIAAVDVPGWAALLTSFLVLLGAGFTLVGAVVIGPHGRVQFDC